MHVLKEGDRIQLDGYQDKCVPQWLHRGWATVIRVKRTGALLIQADGETKNPRTIQSRHILK